MKIQINTGFFSKFSVSLLMAGVTLAAGGGLAWADLGTCIPNLNSTQFKVVDCRKNVTTQYLLYTSSSEPNNLTSLSDFFGGASRFTLCQIVDRKTLTLKIESAFLTGNRTTSIDGEPTFYTFKDKGNGFIISGVTSTNVIGGHSYFEESLCLSKLQTKN